jgi:hypothetical protein
MITPTGEVNAYYDDQKTLAKMMRESIVNSNNSILKEFLKWNEERTKQEYKYEQGFVEELDNGTF